jgi:hypothetical protein
MACDASRITEPNTYRKCAEYSVSPIHHVSFVGQDNTTTDSVTYVMTYEGRDVLLTSEQAARLDTDPTGVCREVM